MKKPLVVILAGGVGKRFEPIFINKTLMPFFGKPILQHVLEMVEKAGFKEALVTTNQENEAWFETFTPHKLTIQTKVQNEALGMGDALLNLEKEIGNNPILVMNAVDMIDEDFFSTLLSESYNRYAYVTGMKVKDHLPAGYLKVNGNLVTEIVEKPAPGAEPSDMVNLVFHYFSRPQDFIACLKETDSSQDDHYEQALNMLMKREEVSVIPYHKYWQKLKYSHYALDMMDFFLKHKLKKYTSQLAHISPNAIIEGDVFIEEGARIEDFAVIKGPAYIGKKAIIGNHCLVRNSIIEANSVIGFGSEVARSYIGPRCMLHHNFIGDSVLESDINPSYGTTTANLRIDGKAVKVKLPDETIQTTRTKLGAIIGKGAFLGVNCSLMPGVTIGANAKVIPGTVVFEAVKSDETYGSKK